MRILLLIAISLLSSDSNAFGAWDQKSDFGGTARHRTVMLTIGNRVYTGLGHYNGGGTNILFDDWWEYDPSNNAWTQKADYAGGICYHAAGFTLNNIAYVGTGRVTAVGNTLVNDFFKYEATTNLWTQIADIPGDARRGAVAFVVGNYGYVGTGEVGGGSGVTETFFRFDPASGSWSAIASIPGARASAATFAIGNFGYVGTGNTLFGSTNDCYRYDPAMDQWSAVANVGPTSRQEACGFSVNGKGYIMTGDDFSSGNNFGDVWEFDPTPGTWTQIGDFAGTARRYLSGTNVGNFAYVGLGTNGTNFKDFWEFDQTVSLMEQHLKDLSITAYPNPTTDLVHFNISWNDNVPQDEISLIIASLTGQIVYSKQMNDVNTIETSHWKNGTYIYSLRYKDRLVKSGKLIVQ